MTKTTVYCDRCKRVIAELRTELAIECGPMLKHRESIDLCGPCAADLTRWLNAPPLAHAPARAS